MINSVKGNYGSCREKREVSNPSFAFWAVGGEYLVHNESKKRGCGRKKFCCLSLQEALCPIWEHLWSVVNMGHGVEQGNVGGRKLARDLRRR